MRLFGHGTKDTSAPKPYSKPPKFSWKDCLNEGVAEKGCEGTVLYCKREGGCVYRITPYDHLPLDEREAAIKKAENEQTKADYAQSMCRAFLNASYGEKTGKR